jgi:hypothetical protein
MQRAAPVNALEASCGGLLLALGVATYAYARSAPAWFVPAELHVPLVTAPGVVAGSLPAFLHTAAFSLLTASALGASRARVVGACAAWAAINVAFEAGQHAAVGAWLGPHLPPWLDGVPLLERVRGYWLAGTFDPYDVAAAVAGSFAAMATAFALRRRSEDSTCA